MEPIGVSRERIAKSRLDYARRSRSTHVRELDRKLDLDILSLAWGVRIVRTCPTAEEFGENIGRIASERIPTAERVAAATASSTTTRIVRSCIVPGRRREIADLVEWRKGIARPRHMIAELPAALV